MMGDSPIMRTHRQALSPWVTLVARTVRGAQGEGQIYHSLSQADYVSVLAVLEDGRIPLVRQYRPALEKHTLELPGGLLDADEAPARTAARELEEEAGCAVEDEPELLGNLCPDTGRLENRFWCFFARATAKAGWREEPGVERILLRQAELREAILDGTFDHALHVAVVGLALLRGRLRWS